MSYRIERAMAWSGLPLMALCFIGYFLAGLLPVPPGANLTPDQITAFYTEHPTATRLGFLLASIGFGFLAPMTAAITTQMMRIKSAPPVLASLQLMGGLGVVIFTIAPTIMMAAAAFRVDRSPVAIQAINDMAWLLLVTPLMVFFCQEVPIAIAIFADKSQRPVFPRWVAYANLWIPLSFLPAFLAFFFTSGPVAWQGILVFYLGLVTFGLWIVIMMWALLRALAEQRADTDVADLAGADAAPMSSLNPS